MTAVPVTGEVRTATGRKDSRDWAAFSPVYREGANGEVITTRGEEFPVRVVAGQFTAMLEPGVVVIVNPDGKQYTVTVPNEAADLWDLIEAAAAYPPDTPQEALNAAVDTYLTTALPPLVETELDGQVGPAVTADLESREVQIVAGTTPGTVQWQAGDALGPEFPANAVLAAGISDAGTVGRSVVQAATQAQAQAAIGAQPIDTDLTAIAGLTSAANKLPYATGAGTWALTDVTGFARTQLAAADAAAARSVIDVPSTSQLTAANVAPATHAATAKVGPLSDTDEVPIADSGSSFGLKKVTVATLKVELQNAGFETETVDLLNRMTVRPSITRCSLINSTIKSLKDYGLWNRIDGLYILAAHNQQGSLLNWRRNVANGVAVNSPTFTTDVGFTLNGSSQYLWNTQSNTVNMTSTNAAISLWLKTLKTVGSWDFSMSGWEDRIELAAAGNIGGRMSSATTSTMTVSQVNMPGLATLCRPDGTGFKIYKDGGAPLSNSTAYNSSGTYTTNIPTYIGVTSGSSGYTNGTYSAWHYGASMNDAETALFYNVLYTYMQAVGVTP